MFNPANYTESAGTGVNKILNPGTSYCRIVDLVMETPPYNKDARNIVVVLEGVDLGDDFEGLSIDRNNPASGTYRGQIARVRNGKFPFTSYEYPKGSGKVIDRDEQIFRWLNALAAQMGKLQILVDSGEEADTIEEYVQLVKAYVVDPENWGFFTIAAEEYTNDKGYPTNALFFPKMENKKYPYAASESEETYPASLLMYDEAKHFSVRKPKAASTDASADSASIGGFGGRDTTASVGGLTLP